MELESLLESHFRNLPSLDAEKDIPVEGLIPAEVIGRWSEKYHFDVSCVIRKDPEHDNGEIRMKVRLLNSKVRTLIEVSYPHAESGEPYISFGGRHEDERCRQVEDLLALIAEKIERPPA